MTTLVTYRGVSSDVLFTRPAAEFFDGRFSPWVEPHTGVTPEDLGFDPDYSFTVEDPSIQDLIDNPSEADDEQA